MLKFFFACAFCLALGCTSCGGIDSGLSPILSDGLPEDCESVSEIFAVENIAGRTEHPCYEWLDAVYGRNAKGGGGGSAAIWSIDSRAETAMVVSASHVIRSFSEDKPGQPSPDRFYDPAQSIGFSFVGLCDPATFETLEAFSASFIFYHPFIPAETVDAAYSNILPRSDFFVMLVDSQMLKTVNGVAPQADPIKSESPIFYDPGKMAATAPTFSVVSEGDMLLLLGFPTSEYGRLSASLAMVLSSKQVEDALESLRDARDEEGFIPYDQKAEAILLGNASSGMSGGGAYDREGRLAGIIVRASQAQVKIPIVRIVRMDHVVASMRETIAKMSAEELALISPYLDRSLFME